MPSARQALISDSASGAFEQFESGIDIGRGAKRCDRLGDEQRIRDFATERLPCLKRMRNNFSRRGIVLGEAFRPIHDEHACTVAISGADIFVVSC